MFGARMQTDFAEFTSFKAPLYIAWETTHRCNARCVHCYSDSSPNALAKDELSTDEGLSVVDQLADAGLMVLAFSGGEPLLRTDWRVLAEHAKSRGLVVNIGTNGSTVTEQVADDLRAIGVNSVTVSLDSDKPATHDHFRRFDGLFEKALHAIERLVARGLRVVVGFTPTTINWHDGKGVVRLAHRLGAAAVNLSEYVPAGRGPIALALQPKELRETLHEWIDLRDEYKGKIEVIWHDCRVSILVPESEKREYLGCGAGRLVGRILPNGIVTPCVFLPTPIGSFRTATFQQMWHQSTLLRQFRERDGHVSGNCKDCEYLRVCGGCRAVAYAYSRGDPLAGDPHCWIVSIKHEDMKGLADGAGLPY